MADDLTRSDSVTRGNVPGAPVEYNRDRLERDPVGIWYSGSRRLG